MKKSRPYYHDHGHFTTSPTLSSFHYIASIRYYALPKFHWIQTDTSVPARRQSSSDVVVKMAFDR